MLLPSLQARLLWSYSFFLDQYNFFCNFIMVELQLYLFVMINSVSSLGGGDMGTPSVFECSFSLCGALSRIQDVQICSFRKKCFANRECRCAIFKI